MFSVTSPISFCYGHRLIGHPGKCAHPHGHNGQAILTFEKKSLDKSGMVLDFGNIDEIMIPWVARELDHQMILRKDDPLVPVLQELKEPIYLMDENPTAENLAKLIFEYAKK